LVTFFLLTIGSCEFKLSNVFTGIPLLGQQYNSTNLLSFALFTFSLVGGLLSKSLRVKKRSFFISFFTILWIAKQLWQKILSLKLESDFYFVLWFCNIHSKMVINWDGSIKTNSYNLDMKKNSNPSNTIQFKLITKTLSIGFSMLS